VKLVTSQCFGTFPVRPYCAVQ